MGYEIVDIEGEVYDAAESVAKQSIRILDQIVFNKFGGIKYSLKVNGSTTKNYPFKLNFTVEVDVDRTCSGTPTYDSDYYGYIKHIEDHIDKGLKIYHFDFYRIEDEDEAYDMGYEEYFFSEAYCFIEWPEKINNLIEEDIVEIKMFLEGTKRRIEVII